MNTRITSNLKGYKSSKNLKKSKKGLGFPHMHVTFHIITFFCCNTKIGNQTHSMSIVQLEVKDELTGRTSYTNIFYK